MPQSDILVGLREIAEYLQRGLTVVRRLVRNDELPVALIHNAYMTRMKLLDEWMEDQCKDKKMDD